MRYQERSVTSDRAGCRICQQDETEQTRQNVNGLNNVAETLEGEDA